MPRIFIEGHLCIKHLCIKRVCIKHLSIGTLCDYHLGLLKLSHRIETVLYNNVPFAGASDNLPFFGPSFQSPNIRPNEHHSHNILSCSDFFYELLLREDTTNESITRSRILLRGSLSLIFSAIIQQSTL